MGMGGMRPSNMISNNGPVRVRKQPNLIQSIGGIFFGILLVLGAPLAMWQAQSQHSAKDFQSAVVVTAPGQSGYVRVQGAPTYAESTADDECYTANCVYEKKDLQELVTTQDLVCKENLQSSEMLRVIARNGSECDEDGTNCVPCYDVEKDTWESQSTSMVLNDVMVNGYRVMPSEGAVYLETVETIVDTGVSKLTSRPSRTVYDDYVLPTQMVVVGTSDGAVVSDPGEKVFVLSSLSSDATLSALKTKDQSSRIMLWIVTFAMLFIGFGLILGPLSWLGRKTGFIPVIGPLLKEGSGALIGVASFLLAVVSWIVIFLAVMVFKLWWISLLVILGFVIFFIVKSKQK